METSIITIIITALFFLIWLFSIVVRDNDFLRKQNREQKIDINKLTQENANLIKKNYELNKK